jgi:predicted dehydrogenase
LLAHPEAELVAVCDKYAPLLKTVADLAGETGQKVTLFVDFDDFIQYDMDAMVLANYAHEHVPFAIRAMEAGMHVLSEVLASETLGQAVSLVETVERTGRVYAYAENYCYSDQTFEMWRRYRNGDIGEVCYAEGEYIHDCSSIMPRITQGNPNHWRYKKHPFFYCTHSFGPIVTVTGLRPKSVVGILSRTVMDRHLKGLGAGHAAIEMITLENGAAVKSIHGGLKREPGSVNYQVYGTKGCMETQRFGESNLNVYMEGDKVCQGTLESYIPQKHISPDLAARFGTHGGSDFYATHFFIQRILGRPEGKEYSIDVYAAVDMTNVGIMAYRSYLNHGVPVKVPDFRIPSERDRYRDDHACTNPDIAGDQLLPVFGHEDLPEVPPEEYEKIKRLWLEGKDYKN